jgi:hypothetical protein
VYVLSRNNKIIKIEIKIKYANKKIAIILEDEYNQV